MFTILVNKSLFFLIFRSTWLFVLIFVPISFPERSFSRIIFLVFYSLIKYCFPHNNFSNITIPCNIFTYLVYYLTSSLRVSPNFYYHSTNKSFIEFYLSIYIGIILPKNIFPMYLSCPYTLISRLIYSPVLHVYLYT